MVFLPTLENTVSLKPSLNEWDTFTKSLAISKYIGIPSKEGSDKTLFFNEFWRW